MLSATMLRCSSPSIEGSGVQSESIQPDEPLILSYGFIMDGVTEVKNYTKYTKEQRVFTVYPNPVILEFDSGLKTIEIKKNEQYLTIKVKMWISVLQCQNQIWSASS